MELNRVLFHENFMCFFEITVLLTELQGLVAEFEALEFGRPIIISDLIQHSG